MFKDDSTLSVTSASKRRLVIQDEIMQTFGAPSVTKVAQQQSFVNNRIGEKQLRGLAPLIRVESRKTTHDESLSTKRSSAHIITQISQLDLNSRLRMDKTHSFRFQSVTGRSSVCTNAENTSQMNESQLGGKRTQSIIDSHANVQNRCMFITAVNDEGMRKSNATFVSERPTSYHRSKELLPAISNFKYTLKEGLKRSTIEEFNLSRQDQEIVMGKAYKYDHINYNIALAANIVRYNQDQLEFRRSPRNKNHASNLQSLQIGQE